jgi:hypothetical protein
VFELFDRFVRPGARAREVAAVLTDRSWITIDRPIDVIAGWVPVELNHADQVFVAYCVATMHPGLGQLWSDWVIYGRIATRSRVGLTAFLAGVDDQVLVEFALAYPDGRIEQYQPTGRKSLHM